MDPYHIPILNRYSMVHPVLSHSVRYDNLGFINLLDNLRRSELDIHVYAYDGCLPTYAESLNPFPLESQLVYLKP